MSVILATLAAHILGSPQKAVTLKKYSLPFGFSMSLPAKPEKWTKTNTGPMDIYFVIADGAGFMVGATKSIVTADSGSPDRHLAASIVGTLDASKGKLVQYRDVLLSGWPGIEFSIEGPVETSLARNFLVDGRLISVAVSVRSLLPFPGYAEQVFDSLVLDDGAKVGPEISPDLPFKNLEITGEPFSVQFPGTPKEDSKSFGQGFETTVFHRFRYERDLRRFIFAYGIVPDAVLEHTSLEDRKEAREAIANEFLNAVHPMSQTVKTQRRNGNEWTTSFFRVADFESGRLEVLFADKRIYMMAEVGPDPWAKSPVFNRFFDSFKLTPTLTMAN